MDEPELGKRESAVCTRIESINKHTTQSPTANFLIHLFYASCVHHTRHCNSVAKAHNKESSVVPKSELD